MLTSHMLTSHMLTISHVTHAHVTHAHNVTHAHMSHMLTMSHTLTCHTCDKKRKKQHLLEINFLTAVGYLLEVFIGLWILSMVRIFTSTWS